MSKIKAKLADILAFPAKTYEKLTDKRASLVAGIVLVGLIDFLLPDVMYVIKEFFLGKSSADIAYNAGMSVVVLLLLGFIDVIFVSVPLFDFFRYIKRKELQLAKENGMGGDDLTTDLQPSAIKVMKIYIMSHFIIVPVSTAYYYAITKNMTESSSPLMQNLALLLFMVIMIWSAAIMARGINVIFRFNTVFKRLTFISVFTWNFLFGMVFDVMIMGWLMRLFR